MYARPPVEIASEASNTVKRTLEWTKTSCLLIGRGYRGSIVDSTVPLGVVLGFLERCWYPCDGPFRILSVYLWQMAYSYKRAPFSDVTS